MTRIALIGLGEVGRIFAEDLRAADRRAAGQRGLVAWDSGFADPTSPASRNAAELDIAMGSSAAEAVSDAELVICAVTAAHCRHAATSAVAGLAAGTWFFDLNSSSPAQKQAAAAVVDATGARYVEAALMAPISPRRLGSPFLLGGPHAVDFATAAPTWSLTDVEVFSPEVGKAAATKLCRSVVVKGLESLLTESLLAARSYGVEQQVLDSLSNILPPADWGQVAEYFMSRSLQHGARRAEEMLDAAATVQDTGVDPIMSLAAAKRQMWASHYSDALDETGAMARIDHILAALSPAVLGSDS